MHADLTLGFSHDSWTIHDMAKFSLETARWIMQDLSIQDITLHDHACI